MVKIVDGVPSVLDSQTCPRCLLSACILIGAKFVQEVDCPSNKNWAILSGLELPYLNVLEKTVLRLLRFDLTVPPATLCILEGCADIDPFVCEWFTSQNTQNVTDNCWRRSPSDVGFYSKGMLKFMDEILECGSVKPSKQNGHENYHQRYWQHQQDIYSNRIVRSNNDLPLKQNFINGDLQNINRHYTHVETQRDSLHIRPCRRHSHSVESLITSYEQPTETPLEAQYVHGVKPTRSWNQHSFADETDSGSVRSSISEVEKFEDIISVLRSGE
eukprot:CFRG2292T1